LLGKVFSSVLNVYKLLSIPEGFITTARCSSY